MDFVAYSKQRYDSAIAEIKRLKNAEFPYPQVREALVQLEQVFQLQRDRIGKLKPASSPSISRNACSQSLRYLFDYTPFLGFILRSTNVRNAFEVYSPVLRLAKQLLGPHTKLLLSSEWDYSPFVLATPDLPDFVLIGVPAFESSNPLIMSLAGHELGHNIWLKEDLGRKYDAALRVRVLDALKGKHWNEFQGFQPTATHVNLTSDMFVQPAWLPAHAYACRQLEELFCDTMGLRIFGEAFLHAFAYLLSPGIPCERYPFYPSVVTRAKHLQDVAAKIGITCPPNYHDMFTKEQDISSAPSRLLCAVADEATFHLVDPIVDEAIRICTEKAVPTRDPAKIAEIVSWFEMVTPAEGRQSLTDLVNAGWVCHERTDLWTDVSQIQPTDRTRVLGDLVLKSLEISEFYDRLGAP